MTDPKSSKTQSSPQGSDPQQEDPYAPQTPEDDKIMSFWDHLDELRIRVTRVAIAFVIAMFVAWYFKDPILNLAHKPFQMAWESQQLPGEAKLHFAAPSDIFVAYFKLSMIAGSVLAVPVAFWELWGFIAPGLYRKEKKWAGVFFTSATVLFVFGSMFAWYAAFPYMFSFFLELTKDAHTAGVTLEPTLMMIDYLDFVGWTVFAFGVVFELPLVLTALSMTGLINYLQMYRFGRYFVMIAAVVAAVISPPDTTSMVVFMVPLLVLYAISIGLAYLFGAHPTPEQLERDRRWAAERKQEELEAKKRREAEKRAEEQEAKANKKAPR